MSINIPYGIKSIAESTFFGCDGLTSIEIPEGVTTIEYKAFESCGGLKSISIPSSIASIRDKAFKDCNALERVNISDLKKWCEIDFSEYGNPLICAHRLFLNGEEIINLAIPNGVTEIKQRAFIGSSIKSVYIPESVTSIADYAFEECTSLSSIEMTDNVQAISSYAFSLCHKLTDVRLPSSIKKIEKGVFYECKKLNQINIPNGVELIDKNAFYGCGLEKINLSSSVKYISIGAFNYCESLQDVYCHGTNPPVHSGYYKAGVSYMFYGTPIENATLHVPESSIEAYKETYPWSEFENIVAWDSEATSIEKVFQENCQKNIYSLSGQKYHSAKKGINIIKTTEGNTRKVYCK